MDLPGVEVAGLAVGSRRDLKAHAPQLVGHAIHEDHVLARGRRVAKAVSQVEAHHVVVHEALRRTPVPRVVVGPHPAAPVEQAKGVLRVKLVHQRTAPEAAACPHANDLAVVVEGMLVLGPRRHDHHRVARLVGEEYLDLKILPVGKVRHAKREAPSCRRVRKAHVAALVLPGNVTLVRACGKAHPAQRHQHQLACRRRRARLEVHHGRRDQPDVAKVGEGQRHRVAPVVYEVVVPVLDPPARLGNALVVVGKRRTQRIAWLAEASLRIKQRTSLLDEMLCHEMPPSSRRKRRGGARHKQAPPYSVLSIVPLTCHDRTS